MRKILIVVDMQNDFIYGCLGSEMAINIVPAVVNKIKKFAGEVLYTMDTHGKDYLMTQEGKNLPIEHCITETPGWEVIDEIKSSGLAAADQIYQKDTFGSRNLATMLAAENDKMPIDSIELIGVCTDICVISNALVLKAFLPEVPIIVDSTCCAGVSRESHETALKAMQACQIKIV